MMSNCKEDRPWSGKKMEGGEGLITLDCLRGRLLAERQASRSAKEEAEFMGKKMIELENQIRKETELRNKAEKRLKLLIKKLESLNIASISVISENSTSSEISTNSSATKETEDQESRSEENQSEKAVPDIAAPKQRDEDKTNQNAPDQTNSSPNTESPNNSCTDPHRYSQISRSRDQSFSVELKEREKEHYIDNPVASVPGAVPAASRESRAMKPTAIIQERARDVHDGVKHVRGNVQSSFERRNHMKAIMSM
ncbi:uncharacterized protein LOC111013694 isoform X1 [Momordica charantia]|uniref:Uncharacterized protein LOC111013694 isoform X1 n=1 Tax=Momordica charantia TaxID=3673 RepID=A0A6J1CS61_MOMCH|nr:uncharacterized protein LOC111013694 isoform X1 [Momordica charantia]XP_022143890.1 uncharacterized protein LOC111013694 isoform X1 [Momordica charantia]XP_022143891.1 uncharacterized protein LOC111013694 isoform X1 [Momordica charantia]XP_022143892.1 uncharacterized protein LOC111013694 isoform X1 [Momordica charantia]